MSANQQALAGLITRALEKQPLPAVSPEEWKVYLEAAQEEEVSPLLYWGLARRGELAALPQKAQAALYSAYAQTWRRNQIILAELAQINAALGAAQIPVVAIKGAAYLLTVYPDPGARAMNDLDLWLAPQHAAQAADIARALGYLDEKKESASGTSETLGHVVALYHPRKRLMAEMHHALAASSAFRYAAPLDWFWEQTQPVENPRYPGLLILSPAANILYASVHAMLQHGGRFTPLRWILDVDMLIRAYGNKIDWEEMIATARNLAWSSALAAMLEQTRELFGTDIPLQATREIESAREDRNAGLVQLLRRAPQTRTEEEWQKWMTLTAYGKFRMALALLLPPPAYMRERYRLKERGQIPFAYLRRWGHILRDILQTIRQLLCNFVKKRLC